MKRQIYMASCLALMVVLVVVALVASFMLTAEMSLIAFHLTKSKIALAAGGTAALIFCAWMFYLILEGCSWTWEQLFPQQKEN